MKKPVKWLLILLAFAVFGGLVSQGNKPKTPEEQAAQKQEQDKRDAWQSYYTDPVIVGRETAKKLSAVNDKHTAPIGLAVQAMTTFIQSGGKTRLDARSIADAALAFDDMRKAYEGFSVPKALPDGVHPALEKARLALRDSARAGTEAFLELQRLAEGKGGSLTLVNNKMSESTRLREAGVKDLADTQNRLQALPAPEQPKQP